MNEMDPIAAVDQALQNLAGAADWKIVGALTAAGIVAMAILQVIKELTPIRLAFQRWWVRGWMLERIEQFQPTKTIPEIDTAQAAQDLVDLSTGGDDRALFELAAEQLVAQLNAAAQSALDYPNRHADLLATLSEGADGSDVDIVVSYAPTRGGETPQEFLDARNRVANRIQRNLDGMQIALASRWQFFMQALAILFTVLIVEGAVWYSAGLHPWTALLAIPIGIVGGYIAPVARDVIAALQSLRR